MTVAYQNNIAQVLDKMDLTRTKDFIYGKSYEQEIEIVPPAPSMPVPKKQHVSYQHISFGQWLINGLRNDKLGPVVVFSSILCTVIPASVSA